MRFILFCVCALFCGSVFASIPNKGLGKNSNKALDLLARGGVAKVYTETIVADVNNLNCSIDRAASTVGRKDATTCSGVSGNKKLALQGEKATELYKLLETVTVARSVPAADFVEVKKMSCRFRRVGGAACVVMR